MPAYVIYATATKAVAWLATQPAPPVLPSGLAFIAAPDGTGIATGAWDVIDGVLVTHTPSFADGQAAGRAAARAYFAGLFALPKGFTVQSALMQIDPTSISNISAGVEAALLNRIDAAAYAWDSGFYWVAADNSHVAMTASQMIAFGHAAFEYVRLSRMRYRAIKDAIAAATTQTALSTIDVTSGYPTALA